MAENFIGDQFDARFSFSQGLDFEMFSALTKTSNWTGRLVPLENHHGIASVEVMATRDPQNDDVIWIYLLEHPLINGELRLSSRSELQILRVLLDNTLEYVFFRDSEGRFIIINRAFKQAIGAVDFPVVSGERIDSFVSKESAQWVDSVDREMFETGIPVINRIFNFSFLNGTTHWLQMSTVPVRNSEGGIVGSVSVARDISEQKKTESELRTAITKAKEANKTKSEFLAAMSHEVRTPINGIIGASELCLETELDREQRDYLRTVSQCSETLLSLVNDVLDFSKIEAGQLNLETLSFSPGCLVEDVAEEFVQTARKKGLELIVSIGPELPSYVMGDPMRVKQVLYNLLGNAIKFTEKGHVLLSAGLLDSSLDANESNILFSVTDTGIGIAQGRQNSIFQSFTQADMSTTRRYGGSGLGLTISRELVFLMNGHIDMKSELGQGATFMVEIPFALSENPGVDVVPYNPELAGLRVLIIDDNETNRRLYRQMCSGWGYRSATTSDGVDALLMLEEAAKGKDPFKLVLLDQQMPGLNGLDVASLISSRPELVDSRMLLLSSSLNRSETERAFQLGVSRALSKPVKRATLLEVILETFCISGDGSGGALEQQRTPVPFPGLNPFVRPLKVLVAEDNHINQTIAKRRLEKMGHTVTVAENGAEAVDFALKNRFDCILMDIQMPDMDGFEATGKIREQERKTGAEPHFIVAMTAHAMKGDAERCLAGGMNDYVSKPFKSERLREVLNSAVKNPLVDESLDSTTKKSSKSTFEERLLSMDVEDREDILSTAQCFVNTLNEDIYALYASLEKADFERITFIAHTIKGMMFLYAAPEDIQFADALEAECKKKDLAKVKEKISVFEGSLRQLIDEVAAHITPEE